MPAPPSVSKILSRVLAPTPGATPSSDSKHLVLELPKGCAPLEGIFKENGGFSPLEHYLSLIPNPGARQIAHLQCDIMAHTEADPARHPMNALENSLRWATLTQLLGPDSQELADFTAFVQHFQNRARAEGVPMGQLTREDFVRPGDYTLHDFAERVVGDRRLAGAIFQMNPDVLGDNPNLIRGDMVLKYPDAVAAAAIRGRIEAGMYKTTAEGLMLPYLPGSIVRDNYSLRGGRYQPGLPAPVTGEDQWTDVRQELWGRNPRAVAQLVWVRELLDSGGRVNLQPGSTAERVAESMSAERFAAISALVNSNNRSALEGSFTATGGHLYPVWRELGRRTARDRASYAGQPPPGPARPTAGCHGDRALAADHGVSPGPAGAGELPVRSFHRELRRRGLGWTAPREAPLERSASRPISSVLRTRGDKTRHRWSIGALPL